jgi:uncharacterized protein
MVPGRTAKRCKTLKQEGNTQSLHLEITTDHPFSDHRIELEESILSWLNQQVR